MFSVASNFADRSTAFVFIKFSSVL